MTCVIVRVYGASEVLERRFTQGTEWFVDSYGQLFVYDQQKNPVAVFAKGSWQGAEMRRDGEA